MLNHVLYVLYVRMCCKYCMRLCTYAYTYVLYVCMCCKYCMRLCTYAYTYVLYVCTYGTFHKKLDDVRRSDRCTYGVRTVTVRGTSAVRPFVVWLRPPSFVSKNRNKRQRGETSKESAVRRKFVILLHMTVNKLQERCCLLPSQTASWLSPDTSLLRVLLKK